MNNRLVGNNKFTIEDFLHQYKNDRYSELVLNYEKSGKLVSDTLLKCIVDLVKSEVKMLKMTIKEYERRAKVYNELEKSSVYLRFKENLHAIGIYL